MGSQVDLLGSCGVIGHVTIRLPGSTSYGWSVVTMRLSGTVTEIWRLKDNGATSVTFWGHVTSLITKVRWKKGKRKRKRRGGKEKVKRKRKRKGNKKEKRKGS